MPQPQMRAADVDREAVARRLGEHMAAGRLTPPEYEDRVARAYAAKTYGELDELTADLPATRPSTPVPQPRPAYSGPGGPAWGAVSWSRGARRAAWGSWFTTALIVVTIWAITSIASGGLVYFWPVWVIGPWGAVLLAQTLTGPRPHRDPEQRRLDRDQRHRERRQQQG
ncbi:DUF1707 SHOCT-like domain-containing protein [Geodermatophilus sp. URMC 64]